ncbi:arginine--tRNA ligase [Proteinivorax hydrogeniformans]|uniref:Arginine--tRNA ligase n=1 Tax=Proteinivorax hydrogeniformans TaxID=1826727 RepID=A0AAU8HPA1_9FIRM
MESYKNDVALILSKYINIDIEKIKELVETPNKKGFGDLAFPTFTQAKEYRKAPPLIAKEIVDSLEELPQTISKAENVGPYINFYINNSVLIEKTVKEVLDKGANYGGEDQGEGKTVVIDFSAPNIAKPFGIGHLRSTVIGNSLYKIHEFFGYKVVGINHIGDWGTQFGKVIVAYDKWGNDDELERDPVKYLYQLYVKFHDEAEKNPDLEEEAREVFKELEEGVDDRVKKWKLFRELSLAEYNRIYEKLNVTFDSFKGEQFYNDKMTDTIETLISKGITEISKGALIINLDMFDIPPVLLRKKDGATLYATRDLCAAIYRKETYDFDKMLYVVGSEQSLHFKQLFKALAIAGFEWHKDCQHVPFGLFRFKEQKMSTRKGTLIFLDEVLSKAEQLTKDIIEEKNPNLPNKDEVARQVGIGAIIFGDLSNDRVKDVVFDWDKILDFNGETAPYVQYSHARICSILRKHSGQITNWDASLMKSEYEFGLAKRIANFNVVINDALRDLKPSIVARYLLDLAKDFNRFYHNCPVLKEENDSLKGARLKLIAATGQVLKNGLSLLGIEAPEEM